MSVIRPLIIGLLLLLVATPLSAAYITDKLLAGIYDKPEAGSSTPVRVLPSGTPLEVLEHKGDFTRIRLSDRSEGWIETRLVTSEKPAQVMLLELQGVTGELRQKLQQAEVALEQSRTESAARGQAVGNRLQDELAAANRHIEALTLEVEQAQSSQITDGGGLPLWLLPLAGLFALLGFISGVIFRNYRLRKRLGGLRL